MSTQKEWELETRIKYLEGTGLQFLIDGFNGKIDKIFKKAEIDLEMARPKPEPVEKPPKSEPYLSWEIEEMARYQDIYGQSQQAQRDLIGQSCAGLANLGLSSAASGGAFRGAIGSIL